MSKHKIDNQPESHGGKSCFRRGMPVEEAMEELVHKIWDRFRDPLNITESLCMKKRKEFHAPVLNGDDREDWAAQVRWEVEYELYEERVTRFKAEWLELCSLILENCDDDLKNMVKDLPNYSEMKKNPLKLLSVIETLMRDSMVAVEKKKMLGKIEEK